MPARRAHISPTTPHDRLAEALAVLREEFEVPDRFAPQVLAEAASAEAPAPELDLRDVAFATLDPAGSLDLDQAFHLERRGDGYLVRYAIADVPGFVRAGGAIDAAARQRGQTLYLPDGRVPLHPTVLSEDRASLLPGEDRTAYVWTIALDGAGAVEQTRVERAVVRSRERLDYVGAQRTIERGDAEGPLALLPEIGRIRVEQERRRGGASLNLPDEEIVRGPAGYRIERRLPLPVEEWNAQLSLLAGMIAGELMLEAGIGVLRTMPGPTDEALRTFRLRVAALGQPWAEGVEYGEYLRGLDHEAPSTPAVLQAAAALFRGADYVAFDGERPEQSEQSAIAAPYAHVTAPLRRLVDRWGLVVCEALAAGGSVPDWVRESLPELPELMRASGRRSGQLTSAALDRVEAALLEARIGDTLPAVVVEVGKERARVQIEDPPVTAHCPPDGLTPGVRASVRVVRADVTTGEIELAVAGSA